MFTFPERLENNIRLGSPLRSRLTEACKSIAVVKVRRLAGRTTLPPPVIAISHTLVVSPDLAEKRTRLSPGCQVDGMIQSCPTGGMRPWSRNACRANVLLGRPPLRGTTHQSTLNLESCLASGLPTTSSLFESGAHTGENAAIRPVCTSL